MVQLGRLTHIDLREVWTDEANHFTPWLANEENLKLLGDTIGLELELESTEKDVGPFRADILCKNTIDGHWVLIENQLEKTDHSHLGQLLTYAAGLKAVTIVWISKQFTDEHRATLDWLNEITDESFSFFGIEIELWRIGDSHVAPKFNIVCKPNDWSKTIQKSAGKTDLTETKQTQFEFWTAFKAYMGEKSRITCQKPTPQHWMTHSIGRRGFHLSSIASSWDSEQNTYDPELRVELVLNDENSKRYFELLKKQKDTIEKEIGSQLVWHNPESKKVCRIYIRSKADFTIREKWPEQHEWLCSNLEKFYKVFAPRIKEL